MRGLALAALAAGLVLSACSTAPKVKPVARGSHRPVPAQTAKPVPPRPDVRPGQVEIPHPTPTAPPMSLARLSGWADEDHRAALAAFQVGCGASRDPAVRPLCVRARALGPVGDDTARAFFEANFEAQPVGDGGVLTAYFAPEYEARDRPDAEFSAPVRPRPSGRVAAQAQGEAPEPAEPAAAVLPDLDDPIDLALAAGEHEIESEKAEKAERAARRAERRRPIEWIDLAHADRATIERSAPNGALAWMRPEDLFFLQIQGSGVLTFPDGRRMKAAYAADNGLPFVAIARPMVERGIFKPNGASGDSIRGWLAANRGQRAQAVMQLNPRYIFFDLTADDGREPAGAAGVPLPAGRAIAVDPSRHAYGDLYWIDAEAPVLAGAHKVYRRLAMALDTGSAIRGQVRADLYVGRGEAAGREAGRVRHTLKMVRLKPIDPARSARHETDDPARGG
jgi:membrane-bound lytic murein transglycosylase A